MQSIDVQWDVEGIISPEQSVSALIKVIESKGIQHSGTFWTWENKVRAVLSSDPMHITDAISHILGRFGTG